ncbi:MAG: zinc-ribbon domain-containing protein [Candidatus Eisenbacteria bacterium]|nr:zinc-ribbon domain-containing protein [Candidatus Eisenbacteria bacterium]
MIVTCAGCGTKYKVSDEKIGPLGVKVRCPKCRTVFEVKRPQEEQPESLAQKLFGKDVVAGLGPSTPPPAEGRAVAPEPSVEAEQSAPKPAPVSRAELEPGPGEPEPTGEPKPAAQPEAASAQEPAAAQTAAGAGVPPGGAPADAAEPQKPTFPLSAREEDPKVLARALVSDILFYNRDSRDRGLAEGKTLALLGREIARSWDTYKERVGVETAVETDFFRQAVNEILGEGREIL